MIEQLLQNLINALNANTAALLGEDAPPGTAPADPNAATAPKRGRGRPPKESAEASASTASATPAPASTPASAAASPASPPAPAPAAAPTPAPAVAVAGSQPTFKQTADVLVLMCEKVSRDAAVALLKQFGASKVPELKPAQYGDFIAAAQAQINAATQAPPAAGAGLI